MSMLDRPISEFDGPADSVRVPVVPPTGECKPFQEVLVELASRLKLPGLHHRRGRAQVQGLPRLRRQLRAAAGHRLPDGLARQGRQRAPARRAESEAVGDVREERLRLPATTCPRRCTTCATGTASTSTSRRTRAGARRTTSVQLALYSDTLQTLPPRRAGQDAGPAAARAPARAHRDLLRPAAVLVSAARGRRDRPRGAIRSPRSRSGRWRCTTRGTRRTRGCARSTATTTCTSTR